MCSPGYRPGVPSHSWLVPPSVAFMVVAGACTADEDVADDPVRPQNVAASVESCEVVDGSAVASVELTNGTGHAAAYAVEVRFLSEDRDVGTAGQRSETLEPGQSEVIDVALDGEVDDVDDCSLEEVEELDG